MPCFFAVLLNNANNCIVGFWLKKGALEISQSANLCGAPETTLTSENPHKT